MDEYLFREHAIDGELALPDFEDIRGEEANQANIGAGQDSHGHQFLDFAVITGAQIGHNPTLSGASIAQRTHFLKSILFRFPATITARDGVTVRTGQGMAEQGADFVFQSGPENMFNLAGIFLRLVASDLQDVFEETFGQTMAANHITAPL